MGKILDVIFGKSGGVVINGQNYAGRNISIAGGKVTIDGVEQAAGIATDQPINVHIDGNVERVTTANGDVTVEGDAGYVETTNGNVKARRVSGSVKTVNGNVTADTIGGGVKTVNGDITRK